jgi:hypothetical protein
MITSASSARSGPKITFSPGTIQLSGVRHRVHITLRTVPLQALLIVIVVGELGPWQILVPTSLVFQNIGSQHIFQDFIDLLMFGYSSAYDRPNYELDEF